MKIPQLVMHLTCSIVFIEFALHCHVTCICITLKDILCSMFIIITLPHVELFKTNVYKSTSQGLMQPKHVGVILYILLT